jgi:hypothetical protein
MAAFNIVRCRVKPGRELDFIDAHRKARPDMKGFAGGWLVKTGERTFCMIGQWRRFLDIVNARPQMLEMLDGMREMLEDLGGDLGVTDPVSGEAVAKLGARRPARKTRPTRTARGKKKARPVVKKRATSRARRAR